MIPSAGTLLIQLNLPSDLKQFKLEQLPLLCAEIRQFIIDEVTVNDKNLEASLGTVELAVALHYVYNAPFDKIIWDDGHQTYAHKIITGRKNRLKSIRTFKGISGFPKISESEFDAFGVGHSSTSISAALGMAISAKINGQNDRHHIAIIGDGALTSGMALEALNNAGVSNVNLLVILNDNQVAIDKNVAAIKDYLANIVTSKFYNKIRDKIWLTMGGGTKYGKNSRAIVKQLGNVLKTTLLKSATFFEAFNFRYFGPVDGHDVIRLVKFLKDVNEIKGPKLLHIQTIKGNGFDKTVSIQKEYLSQTLINKTIEKIKQDHNNFIPPKYSTVFGGTIIELAEKNCKIVGITPTLSTNCSLSMMMNKMPERTFNVGISEQHAVTFCAGLAAAGYIPFLNIYSTFMQRGYDQIIHDVALQNLHVVFCIDCSGLVGRDGATHHGVYDLAYLRCIPNMTIASPMNEEEFRNLMFISQMSGIGPFAIRYPKVRGVLPHWEIPMSSFEIGKGRLIRNGIDAAIITLGHVGNYALEACSELEKAGYSVAHYDLRFLKPLDEMLLHEIFAKFKRIITIEDGTVVSGMGSTVLEFMADHGYNAKIKRLGVPDHFIEQGTIQELQHECGFDTQGIIRNLLSIMG